jgi:DNA-binding GntR family transcriptional regulator
MKPTDPSPPENQDAGEDRVDRAGVEGLQPLQRTRLVDEVTETLREWILSGEIPPGTHLLQVELSRRFGVSRTPLREAFRVLERDGLIRMANGNKTLEVVAPTTKEIIDKYQFREFIDGFAASLLARNGVPPQLAADLALDVDTMGAAIDGLDLSRFGAAHTHFHAVIVESCGNNTVQDTVPSVRMSSQMMVARQVTESASVANLAEETRRTLSFALTEGNRDHQAILEAIVSGDSVAAEAAARRHIQKGMRSIERLSRHTAGGAAASEEAGIVAAGT